MTAAVCRKQKDWLACAAVSRRPITGTAQLVNWVAWPCRPQGNLMGRQNEQTVYLHAYTPRWSRAGCAAR
eukprot:2479207-Pyramimonas_sp.AAC.1